jgi:hypothetical protein
MGAGTRRVREWSTKIWSKASQIRGFLLPFIFATSTCLIHFDRERPNRLRHAIILGGSFLGMMWMTFLTIFFKLLHRGGSRW